MEVQLLLLQKGIQVLMLVLHMSIMVRLQLLQNHQLSQKIGPIGQSTLL